MIKTFDYVSISCYVRMKHCRKINEMMKALVNKWHGMKDGGSEYFARILFGRFFNIVYFFKFDIKFYIYYFVLYSIIFFKKILLKILKLT